MEEMNEKLYWKSPKPSSLLKKKLFRAEDLTINASPRSESDSIYTTAIL